MSDFTITERTEPFTLDEVFEFIEDSSLSTIDVCELKSRIMDAVQEIRAKAIDEFAEKFIFKAVCEGCSGCCNCYEEGRQSECEDWKVYMEIAEQMKGGAE